MSIQKTLRVLRSFGLVAVYSQTAGEFRFGYPRSREYWTAFEAEEAVSLAQLLARR